MTEKTGDKEIDSIHKLMEEVSRKKAAVEGLEAEMKQHQGQLEGARASLKKSQTELANALKKFDSGVVEMFAPRSVPPGLPVKGRVDVLRRNLHMNLNKLVNPKDAHKLLRDLTLVESSKDLGDDAIKELMKAVTGCFKQVGTHFLRRTVDGRFQILDVKTNVVVYPALTTPITPEIPAPVMVTCEKCGVSWTGSHICDGPTPEPAPAKEIALPDGVRPVGEEPF